ncbi:hypothetical protein ACHAW5_002212 [Stephanodiscus triporus]|uniref:Uncharacterized protein n=1 Tax=Stephanodiscus triporus TaxID=2934178 RepID=A0ABD3P600_9STRA
MTEDQRHVGGLPTKTLTVAFWETDAFDGHAEGSDGCVDWTAVPKPPRRKWTTRHDYLGCPDSPPTDSVKVHVEL